MTDKIVNFDYTINPFYLTFRPVSRPVLPWRDEVLATARLIAESTTKPIFLCFSGGIDSEVIVRSFIEIGAKFTVLILRHTEGTNQHDIEYAMRFCNENNVEYQVHEFNATKFFKAGVKKYIDQGCRAVNLFRYLQLYLIDLVESLGGCAVLGSGEQIYYNVDGQVCIGYTPELYATLEWCKRNNTIHYPYFFTQTPELYAAYLQLDKIQKLTSDANNFPPPNTGIAHPTNIGPEKKSIYHQFWPELTERPKFSGFEKIMDIRLMSQKILRAKFPDIQTVYTPVPTIKQQLGI